MVRAECYYILCRKANDLLDVATQSGQPILPSNVARFVQAFIASVGRLTLAHRGHLEGDGLSDEFSTTSKNTVRQLREKARYDRKTVHAVLDAGLVAYASFGGDEPVVVPMIYGRDGDTLYLHGARKARVVRMLEKAQHACVNVTLIDGIVFARSAFNSSMNYRSVTVFGTPHLVEDTAHKLSAMRTISEHVMPGRWDELREPLDKEVKMTGVIELPIDSASAKISAGLPSDEDEDYAIPIWAGTLPLDTKAQDLLDDERLHDGVEPSAAVRSIKDRY